MSLFSAVTAVKEEKGWVSKLVHVLAIRIPVINHNILMERTQSFIVHEHGFTSRKGWERRPWNSKSGQLVSVFM